MHRKDHTSRGQLSHSTILDLQRKLGEPLVLEGLVFINLKEVALVFVSRLLLQLLVPEALLGRGRLRFVRSALDHIPEFVEGVLELVSSVGRWNTTFVTVLK